MGFASLQSCGLLPGSCEAQEGQHCLQRHCTAIGWSQVGVWELVAHVQALQKTSAPSVPALLFALRPVFPILCSKQS